MNTEKLKILIADDHPILIQGLAAIISRIQYVDVILEAENGQKALEIIREQKPHIAVLDIDMPGLTGIEVAQATKDLRSETKIVFITLHKERSLFNEARKMGVSGYLLKEFSIGEIERCIYEVSRGNEFISAALKDVLISDVKVNMEIFTKTERNILLLIAKEKTTIEIADMLFVSPKTIETHRRNIVKKLNLKPEKNSLIKWVYKYHKLLV